MNGLHEIELEDGSIVTLESAAGGLPIELEDGTMVYLVLTEMEVVPHG
jgi:hypothetical protein